MLYIENNYNDIEISLSMEIHRGLEYCKLHDNFLKSCINNLGINIFHIKKK